jgi:hypothetical protein
MVVIVHFGNFQWQCSPSNITPMGKKDKHTDSEGSDSDDSKKGRKEKKHDKKDKDKDKDKDKKHKAHDDVHSGYPGLSSPYVAPQHPPGPQTHTHGQSPPIVDPHVYGQLGGQQHQQIPVHSPPPATVHANVNAPPSGFRLPLSTTSPFPPPDQCGPPPTFDLDGDNRIRSQETTVSNVILPGSPVYVGSALLQNAVHPCKIAPRHSPPCLVRSSR